MYEEYYGLTEKPFSILPDPSFIYWAPGHDYAYSMLEYGVMNRAGFTVVTGEIGCGKTTLVRQLLHQIDDSVTIGLLTNTIQGPGRLLEWVMMSLNQPFDSGSYVALYQKFHNFLIQEYAQERHVVLIIDEAQNLDAAALEELRMLSNINADKDQLVQLILIGQPQLRELLQSPELVQFSQRVSCDYHLLPLDIGDVGYYINHRMHMAGAVHPIFYANAIELIGSVSCGIPRTINILCDTSLVYGYSMGARRITERIIRRVLDDKRQYGVFSDNSPATEAVNLNDWKSLHR